jgi:ribosome-binding ATPase YchF (GTP1/OBG family)|tara:strand:+ start:1283 stop:1714 length:432 start_codon:yes stop_codon:yes gene_type:complete
MKTNLEKNMEAIFDLPTDTKPMAEIIEKTKQITPLEKISSTGNDEVMDDYYYARENLKEIISSAQQSIADLSSIASTSESPRAYEVLSTMMKTIVDANKDLLELQKSVKKLKEEDKKDNPQNVTNALYVGSTGDLMKLIKDNN